MNEPTIMAITLVYYLEERKLRVDIGNMPAPLAQRLCEMAADDLADTFPVDEVVTTIAGVDYTHSMVGDDDDGDE